MTRSDHPFAAGGTTGGTTSAASRSIAAAPATAVPATAAPVTDAPAAAAPAAATVPAAAAHAAAAPTTAAPTNLATAAVAAALTDTSLAVDITPAAPATRCSTAAAHRAAAAAAVAATRHCPSIRGSAARAPPTSQRRRRSTCRATASLPLPLPPLLVPLPKLLQSTLAMRNGGLPRCPPRSLPLLLPLPVLSVGAARWGEHESDKQRPATLHGVHRRKAHHLPHLRTHTRRRGAQPKLVARQRARWGWELTLNRVPHCLCNGAFPASVQPPRPSTALPTRAGVAPTGAFRSFEAVEGQQPVRLLASVAPPRAPQCCKRFAAKTVGASAHRVRTRRRPHAAPLVGLLLLLL